ncbi:MAG: metal-dependent transcriptional regulator [Anaerolineae bacterium]|nr:metal-dependent transcriptional regulator [Anaerolineae bacterium]
MTDTIEDYLSAIYHLHENAQPASTTRLAQELQVAPATVTAMLKKLAELGLVEYKPYQPVALTRAGRQAALRIIRFHRLAETFLVNILDVPWELVHEEAHKWEHVLSDDIAARLERMLDFPSHDPHGDPIPTTAGVVTSEFVLSLAEVQVGQRVIVSRIQDESPALLQYLSSLGVYPKVEMRILAKAPFEGPLTVRIGERAEIVGFIAAEQILVSVLV